MRGTCSESASVGIALGDELGDDGELGVGVDLQAGAVEGLVTHTPGVEVASVLVANTSVTVSAITAVGAGAASLRSDRARVRSVGSSHLVGLPDIHLGAARAVLALSGVDIVGCGDPAFRVALEGLSIFGLIPEMRGYSPLR